MELLYGALDDIELVGYEVGRVALVRLCEYERAGVLAWGETQDARDRQVLDEPVPVGAHVPVEQRSRGPSVAIFERMIVGKPEVQEDRPQDGVDEPLWTVAFVSEIAQGL